MAEATKRVCRALEGSTTAVREAQLRLGLELRRKFRERHIVHGIVACGCQKAVQIKEEARSFLLLRPLGPSASSTSIKSCSMCAAAFSHAVLFGNGPPGTSATGTSAQCSGAEVLLIVRYNALVPVNAVATWLNHRSTGKSSFRHAKWS